MAKYNFYAVKRGYTTGIFASWDECSKSVKGFKGAEYKGFIMKSDAEAYLSDKQPEPASLSMLSYPHAFIDGSFNDENNTVAWGGIISVAEGAEEITVSGSTSEKQWLGARNVSGEIFGCMAALKKAYDLGIRNITIYHDYEGIGKWATGSWSAKEDVSIAYVNYVRRLRESGMSISFIKVKGHSGIPGNVKADSIARKAASLTA